MAVELDPRGDKFAKTFRAKADALKLWPLAFGAVEEGQVRAAICLRIGKRTPLVANLELLHTFAAYRRLGFASGLVLRTYDELPGGVEYFRVSSELGAVPFYRSLGLKFWGEQKSGSLLSMHRVQTQFLMDGDYTKDKVIQAALNSGRRGSLVKEYKKPW